MFLKCMCVIEAVVHLFLLLYEIPALEDSLSLSTPGDRHLSCFHGQMSHLPSYTTCLGQITWQKLLGYWDETIRLPDLKYHWPPMLTGNINAHLITTLKDIVLTLEFCDRNIC